jgi:hypothetical protein
MPHLLALEKCINKLRVILNNMLGAIIVVIIIVIGMMTFVPVMMISMLTFVPIILVAMMLIVPFIKKNLSSSESGFVNKDNGCDFCPSAGH